MEPNITGIMQAYNRKAVNQQLQTLMSSLFYKSNRIKEYILKSEVKIKQLKNHKEKKYYVHIFTANRLNIIQV